MGGHDLDGELVGEEAAVGTVQQDGRDVLRLVEPDGRALAPAGELPAPARLLAGYRAMVRARRLDEQAYALVRQGRLAVYPSSRGQEACQVAAAHALRGTDWLFPTYRDCAAVQARGVDPAEVLAGFRGDRHCGYDPVAHRTAPQATPLATQLLHATGLAHAARLRGEDTVALALCGDGATSEGDFHEALNFAAVFRAPVVFLVQDNKYAISVPTSRQYAAASLADRGAGYGVPGVSVDGNDLAALLVVLDTAVGRARAGEGPTLVVADTYRLESHTNADDAGRYRSAEEVEHWRARDPLTRLRAHLRATGTLDDELERGLADEAEREAARLREELGREAPADPDELFEHVYTRMTPQLREERDALRAELASGAAS